jgi:hypothetical protein
MDRNQKTIGKKIAVWAAIGAVVAIPVPIVGPFLGAAAGAGLAYLSVKKKS